MGPSGSSFATAFCTLWMAALRSSAEIDPDLPEVIDISFKALTLSKMLLNASIRLLNVGSWLVPSVYSTFLSVFWLYFAINLIAFLPSVSVTLAALSNLSRVAAYGFTLMISEIHFDFCVSFLYWLGVAKGFPRSVEVKWSCRKAWQPELCPKGMASVLVKQHLLYILEYFNN